MDPTLIFALLNVTPEAELQREIRDIIDELDIILHIAKQKNDMISRFFKHANQIMDADVSKYKEGLYDQKGTWIAPATPECGWRAEDEAGYKLRMAQNKTWKLLSQQKTVFGSHSEGLLSEIDDRIKELSGLKPWKTVPEAQHKMSVYLPLFLSFLDFPLMRM